MAHVKVVRRSMREPEWIALRAEWLSRRVLQARIPTDGWQIREARQVGECSYEYIDPEFRPLNKGDMMFTPDGTAFLQLKTALPAALAGQTVWLSLMTGAEMQVKCNGRWIGGLDPNRERVLVAENAVAGEKLQIEIEGYNRSKPDDERNIRTRHLRGCRQAFAGASFVVVDPVIEAATYDVQILLETMNSEYVRDEIRAYITEHLSAALGLVDYEEQDPDAYRTQVEALRAYLAETVFSAKKKKGFGGCGKVALVAHSHLDIAYYWRRVHAVQKNARTCMVQLRLMDRYPEFRYAHTQAFTYELLEQHYPDLFEEVKQRIAEGRFEPVGGMYVEPDCNVPTAESLVRQCLYGQHYYRSRFGRTVNNCWLPDVFGNSWILPQILRKSGIDYFVSNKMSTWNDTNRFPHNHFLWRGIDGSEIPACVPPTHFITWNSPDQIIENWEAFQEKETANETLNMFGFGDGGSGVTEQMLEYMRRLDKVPGLPEIRHCRGDEFLADNLADPSKLAVWDGELYLEMHRGTFTTNGALKRQNRELEILLRDAELLAAFAAERGFRYPLAELTKAWKLLLVNQFHDILPGTHIAPVTRDALADYAEVRAAAEQIVNKAAHALGLEQGEGNALTILNTLGHERAGAVFLEHEGLQQASLQSVNCQHGTKDGRPGLWAELPAIPAVGARAFALVDDVTKTTANDSWHRFESGTLTTPFYTARINADGSFSSLIERASGRELVAPGEDKAINRVAVFRDNPGTYDAWDILPNYKEREESYDVAEAVSLESAGPVCLVLLVRYRMKQSTWTQRIRFFRSSPRIEFEHHVDWHERNRLAKTLFDLNILSRHARCDTSAGTVLRETHANTTWQQARFEVCHHKWASLSEEGFGVALLNDGKYGIGFDRNRVGLSLLRGSIRPDPCSDEGEHRFTYALLPHEGTPESAGVVEAAWDFNVPLYLFAGADECSPLVTVDAPNLHLQTVKQAEDGSGDLVVRVSEVHGRRGRATLALPRAVASAEAVDLLEDPCGEPAPEIRDRTLSFDFKPNEILTFRVRLEKV